MRQSPPKRRKIEPTQSQTTNGAATDNGQPTTPTRASYLSPTKSSLARSHPHLITRSSRRSVTEPRGKLLRDEILGRSDHIPEAPKTASQVARPQSVGLSIGASFVPANQNPSKRDLSELVKGSTTSIGQPTEKGRPALKERQPAKQTAWERSAPSQEPSSPVILPKLIPRKETDDRPVPRGASGEPELPPTPVELGLSPAPERPRGLASSSSPRDSKMSRRSGRWGSKSRGPLTSSPLKPRAPPAVEPSDEENESMQYDVQEAPESETEEAQRNNEEMTEESGRQASSLDSLYRRLQQLKKENEQLQAAIDDDDDLSEETVSMLRQSLLEDRLPRSFEFTDGGANWLSHLTFFAPGNLQLNAQTETKAFKDRTKIIHLLKVEAPPPWPPDALSCVFEVVVDAQTATVEHVDLKEAMGRARRTKSTKTEIYKWVNDRLEHPLHRLDVGGLIWGIGRWFNAAVERAKIFHWMNIKYNRSSAHVEHQNEDDGDRQLTQEKAIELARYLDMTENTAVDAEVTATAGGKKFRKKVMLIWTMNIDWAGGLRSDIQTTFSGIPQKAEPGLRTVFCSLIPTLGVKGAFENIWSLLHGDGDEFRSNSELKGKKKG
ncbi:uncharacterized protein Z519_08528 [Cladophialophora bantiana CBS 173.52]|uniref:Uncharacterized protein n=1 Tax=Cladophialophora bantiana (strain ATCC 10958 / CBS 173.52 / CDC B-1940 / NIH 8579) TaxID=1442370 RepID=A0A0D2HJ10_CLAB1|nr:uncharacterized protein Z519_08528 [Cladophialophora bantiana CBS 173.52]KIW90745.1 hypothetical protein Z519_08528 [Cladophialophora bantiana CBS 173.52]